MTNSPFLVQKNRLENTLKTFLATQDIPAPLIAESLEYVLLSGGKRLRPVLVYLCGEIAEVPVEVLDPIAAAIEMIHCYSLVHDDLPAMDDDDFRRDRPSCHKAFDEATAILVGDGLQALAIELLVTQLEDKLPAQKILKIIQTLTHAAGISGMVSGQSLDLTLLSRQSITREKLNQIHTLKTGALFNACVQMVIDASHLDSVTQNTLTRIGQTLGLVFQMQDDYLDCYGGVMASGKKRASDAENQKTTFATLLDKKSLLQEIEAHYSTIESLLNQELNHVDALKVFISSLKKRLNTIQPNKESAYGILTEPC